jgi:non-ribosomal peptide synthetase component F
MVNYANLTPSVAELLDPAMLPKLQVLILGGELVSQDRLSCSQVPEHLLIGYGPAECTIIVTGIDISAGDVEEKNIGPSIGATTWIVDPDDHDRLLGLGDIGKLLIEGPLVGVGYLHDPTKTSEVFINDPQWLVEGTSGTSGRNGRVYKTGDLVRYNDDGSLVFLSRKGSQVKIRGQRVELSEIEHHLPRLLLPGI